MRPSFSLQVTRHWNRKSGLRFIQGVIVCLLAAPCSLYFPLVAKAQSADVIRPGPDGDFRSIQVPGNRGSYTQRYWLVVDRDPRGLWCRDPWGRPSIALKYGSVIESSSNTAPLQIRQGKSYLQVSIKPEDILYDARLRGARNSNTCLVRANSAFIAPINPDSMGALRP